MAEVYEAIDDRLSRPVAVKMLRPEVAATHPDVRARLEAEARSAAGLSHPNVVAVYDTGEHQGLPFIVMERLPGETLAQHIQRGPVDLAWLRVLAGDVLGALAAAHAAGIVHRDIKPGNILIAENGCAKVADFGIAKSLEGVGPDLTGTNLLLGTPAYMAPERVAGEPATAQCDIYGLGVVLYEAAAGRKPFTGATPVALAHAIRQGGAEPLTQLRPDVDPRFAAVVEQAMALDPAARFASAAAMAAALAGGPSDETVPIAAPVQDATMTIPAGALVSGGAAARLWARPRVRVAAVAAAALVVIGAVVAGAGTDGEGSDAEPPPTTVASVPTTVATTTPPTTAAPRVVSDNDDEAPPQPNGRGERRKDRGNEDRGD